MSFWRNRETSVSRHFCNHQNFPHNKKYGGRETKNDKQEHWRLLNKAVIISEIFLIDHDGVISWSLMLQKMSFHCFQFPSKNPGQYMRGCEKSQWWQHEVHIHSFIMCAMKSETVMTSQSHHGQNQKVGYPHWTSCKVFSSHEGIIPNDQKQVLDLSENSGGKKICEIGSFWVIGNFQQRFC